MLRSWEVSKELPPHPGFGHRRHRPSDEGVERQQKRNLERNLAAAGHAESKAASGSADCGPDSGAVGHGCGPQDPDPWAQALTRVRGHLQRARDFQAWIGAKADRTAADLARKEGLSRARVCQVLKLLELAPAIVEDIDRPGRRGPVPSELQLRRVTSLDQGAQLRRYRDLLKHKCTVGGGPRPKARQVPRRRGFQHDFARARRYQAMFDTGDYPSLVAVGRSDGLSGARVSQLLNLLHLAPQIIVALDVPDDECPAGVTKKDMRSLARLRDHKDQVEQFERRWPDVLEQSREAHAAK